MLQAPIIIMPKKCQPDVKVHITFIVSDQCTVILIYTWDEGPIEEVWRENLMTGHEETIDTLKASQVD